jgi:aromatic ring-opening dioxygenase catalytic subunit (LigB family)
MGEIVLAVAAAHAPGLTGWMDKADTGTQAQVTGAYRELGQRIREAELDVLVMVANDHLANYNPDDYPDFVVGTADQHTGPAEWFKPWLNVEDYAIPGNPALAEQLHAGLIERDDLRIELNDQFNFDDNISVPVTMTGFRSDGIPLIPIIQNCTVPPVPDQRRSYEFGVVLREVLRGVTPPDARVGLFGSGGLSHEPGGPRYLEIDEEFDRWFLELLADGDHSRILREATLARMEAAGAGGTAELLSWIAVMGAIGERDCEVLCYACVPDWRCGVGAVAWSV